MSERCAVCGADDIWKRVALPDAWASYLAAERGLAPAEGYYLLPTCDGCSEEVSMRKELDDVMGEMDDDSRALLDDLDVDALVDEH